MSENTNFDNYRYDNNSRRTVRADGDRRMTAAPRAEKSHKPTAAPRTSGNRRTASDSGSTESRRQAAGSGTEGSRRVSAASAAEESRRPSYVQESHSGSAAGKTSPSILYDARGVRIKKSRLSNEFVRTLLFLVLPYILVNAAVFIIVTASPKVEVSVSDTDNYTSVTAKFTVTSLLPVKELTVTMESEPIEYKKSGSSYTAELTKNGIFYIEATSVNGMRSVGYADVSVLDDTPPVIDETSCHIESGILTFIISDSQAGVNWSNIYGIASNGEKVLPGSIDKEKGRISIPMLTDSMELHFSDMVGNARSASVTATGEQMAVAGPVVEEGSDGNGDSESGDSDSGDSEETAASD